MSYPHIPLLVYIEPTTLSPNTWSAARPIAHPIAHPIVAANMAMLTFIHHAPLTTTSNRLVFYPHSTFVRPLHPRVTIPAPVATARLSLTQPPKQPSTPDTQTNPRRNPIRFGPIASVTTAIAAAFLPFLPAPAKSAQLYSAHSYPTAQLSAHSLSTHRPSSSPLIRLTPRTQHNSASLATAVPAPSSLNFSSLKVLLPKKADTGLYKLLKSALLLGIATSIIIAITISVFWIIQDSLVYKPTKEWRGTPKHAGMPYYDDVNYCTIDGAEISGWFIKQPPERYQNSRTLIYFHGTDKNASFRLKKVIGLYNHCQCNILLLSYRGYGLSTGKPNERGVRIDAESAYRYLKRRGDVNVAPGGNLWVYGESLGGAVAIYFSKVYQNCINALILENTFTSLLDMIKLEFPILGVFRYLSRNRWQSKKRIGDLRIPLLFLSGLRDSYIPPAMMKKMHSLATSSPLKEFVEFERGTHNRTWTADGFYESVARFMDRVDSSKANGPPLEPAELSASGGGKEDTGRYAAT